jgi:hypothetical protein
MENVKRGKLKLKNGSKLKVASKHKKHKKTSKRREEKEERRDEQAKSDDVELDMDDLTPAQRRHAEHQKKRVRPAPARLE